MHLGTVTSEGVSHGARVARLLARIDQAARALPKRGVRVSRLMPVT
ncbi:hypothetical protein A176_005185 [Myxococcus hansupus]|uniref:Uncharacterized protein n=1 Tax=Pseudomyxococcus hansupus TaxID=1297742 RepID=A0A0H4X2Z5_9BACT|nr:hypothetical protein A176_005185 [Myxococcus hansupus]